MTSRDASSCLIKKIHTEFSTHHKVHSHITEKKRKGQKISSGSQQYQANIAILGRLCPKDNFTYAATKGVFTCHSQKHEFSFRSTDHWFKLMLLIFNSQFLCMHKAGSDRRKCGSMGSRTSQV